MSPKQWFRDSIKPYLKIIQQKTQEKIDDLFATDDEFNAGTLSDKAVSVKQLTDSFNNATITDAEALEDWSSV